MLQTRHSRWTAATGLICAVIMIAAWFLMIGPRRSEAADLRSQREQAESMNDGLQLQIAKLKAQFADLPARQAELAAIRTQLPQQAELPKMIRDIDKLGKSAGVELTTITPSAPVQVDIAEPGASPAGVNDSAAGGSTAGGATSGGQGANTLYAIPTSIVVTGNYFHTAQFIRLVQTSTPRAFLVTGVTVERVTDAAAGVDGDVSLTLAGQFYVLLDGNAQLAQAQVPAGTTTAPSPGATPSPTTSPSPGATPSPTTSPSSN